MARWGRSDGGARRRGGGLHRGTRGRRCGRENSASVSWVLAWNRRARARHRLEPARPDPSLTDRTTALMTAAATRPDPIAPTTRQFEFAGGLARAQSVRLGPRAAGDVRPLSAPVLGGATAVAFPPPPPPLIACPSWRSAPGCRSGSRYRPPADTPAGTPTPARRWSRSPRAKERSTTAISGCPAHKYATGTSFFQPTTEVHNFGNEGSEPLVVYALYYLPAGTPNTGIRIDQPQPASCPTIP